MLELSKIPRFQIWCRIVHHWTHRKFHMGCKGYPVPSVTYDLNWWSEVRIIFAWIIPSNRTRWLQEGQTQPNSIIRLKKTGQKLEFIVLLSMPMFTMLYNGYSSFAIESTLNAACLPWQSSGARQSLAQLWQKRTVQRIARNFTNTGKNDFKIGKITLKNQKFNSKNIKI